LRRPGATQSGRRSRPETPLLGWKIHNAARKNDDEDEKSPPRRECRRRGREEVVVSARKLAAGLWRLQMPEMVTGAVEQSSLRRNEAQLGLQVKF
jgi:hypothetical protein